MALTNKGNQPAGKPKDEEKPTHEEGEKPEPSKITLTPDPISALSSSILHVLAYLRYLVNDSESEAKEANYRIA